ncbi:acyl-ACP--UDP-N-acetylglucosamine O-acyltransferase [Rhodovibrio salinarum]|uniref:Acyl-[acyl-carrier-protein]--UDP-N-acetylglucosamine O-acyltransferase n=1 Tax=Rhodovibrio salinarum TaxID=1087 RepID=A0A934QJ27_9PROT|nr:acyl-ACP--UDP-N-acetylglucosamine O-acyltransferase [Rhodovibrio salinarum]MBK1697819.1 acyl-ACP--UDP-N-acetylglucosamine O-acyltransferase [Rhodovibrio salinarum]
MSNIHATAVVDPAAKLADDVTIGPYSIVGPNVVLDPGVVLRSHAVVEGHTRLGSGVQVYPFAAVGTPPQDLKYKGEESRLEVGAGTVIREHCTLNPGTEGDQLVTSVGQNCVLMIGAHVAHDCRVADGVIMANQATLAGHVQVGAGAFLGGLCAVHQFCRIGAGAMIGGMSGVENDVIPYGLVTGNRARLNGLNVVGLKRRGVGKSEVQKLRAAYQELFHGREGTFRERVDQLAQAYGDLQIVDDLIDFVRADSSRALCQPQAENAG